MRLLYGANPAAFNPADEVELHVLRTLKRQQRNVYDESNRDVVCQEVDIEVIAALNPAAVSYGGDTGVRPTRLPGMRSVVTFRAIRHKLMEERRVLRWLTDEPGQPEANQTDLRSPQEVLEGQPPYLCDVLGGPYPQDCHVVAYWGEPKTIILYYRVKTYVNECNPDAEGDPQGHHPVVSHRWSQRSDVDHDHFATRITEGVMYFDVAELVRRGHIPDQYRKDVHVPVPTNFQREHVQIMTTPDGSQLRYVLVDREKSHLFKNSIKATRIEIYHTEHSHQPSPHSGIRNLFKTISDLGGKLAALFEGNVGAMGGSINLLELALPFAPTYETSIFIRIWGDRRADRAKLARLAMSLAVARVESPENLKNLPVRDSMITRDLYGKFVEFQLKLAHPPSPNSLGGLLPSIVADDDEDINGADGSISQADGNTNPAFPFVNETRGTWVAKLFAADLRDACGNPDLPVTINDFVLEDNSSDLSGQDF